MDEVTRQRFRAVLVANGYHVRDRDSFRHATEVVKPFGAIDDIIRWCKSECREDWRWQMVDMSSDHRPGRYIFYFDSDQDYFAFTLKWS